MFLLLDLLLSAILEGPLHNTSLRGSTLDMPALIELAPEVVKVLQLDQVPNLGERSRNDSTLGNGRGGGDPCRHDGLLRS